MSYDTITLTADYTTRGGVGWPAGTELELEQKLRQGWQVGYRTPDGRVGTASVPRDELPPEVSQVLSN
jgi:hypothetical protein